MRAKHLPFLMIVALLLSPFLILSTDAALTPTMNLSPSAVQLAPSQLGSVIQVNITVQDVSNLWQWQSQVLWDPSVLNLTATKEPSGATTFKGVGSTLFLSTGLDGLQIPLGNLPDIESTYMSPANSFNGSGTLATLNFTVISVQPSQIQLNNTALRMLNAYGNATIDISHTSVIAQITTTQPTPTTTPSSTSGSSPTETPTSSPTSTETPAPSPAVSPTDNSSPAPTDSVVPTDSPASSSSPTPPVSSNTSTAKVPELTTVYVIVIAGTIIAVIIAFAGFVQRKR